MSSEMNTIQTTFFDVIKTQYQFKFRAHHGMFSTMIIVQLIALLLSFSNNQAGVGINNISVNGVAYSGDMIILLTIAWAGIMAFKLTMKQSTNIMFTFVANRKTNHISNILFIISLSIIGSLSAYFLSFIFRISIYLWKSSEMLLFNEEITLHGLLIGLVATVLYALLFSAVAYIIGEIIQLHRVFIVIVPTVIFGFIVMVTNFDNVEWINQIVPFVLFETNFYLFFVKCISISIILFFLAMFVGHRLEVRK